MVTGDQTADEMRWSRMWVGESERKTEDRLESRPRREWGAAKEMRDKPGEGVVRRPQERQVFQQEATSV